MSKYHISKNGNPGLCKADVCPLGEKDDHYGTKAEARKAFESSMDKNSFQPYKKISFEKHKESLKDSFIENFPLVKIIRSPRPDTFDMLSLRKDQEVVFKAMAKNEYDPDYNQEKLEKWAADNNLRVITNNRNIPRGKLYILMVISKPKPSPAERMKLKQAEVEKLQREIKRLDKESDNE